MSQLSATRSAHACGARRLRWVVPALLVCAQLGSQLVSPALAIAEPAAELSPEHVAATQEAPDAPGTTQLSAAAVTGSKQTELQAALLRVRSEREGTTRLWPLVMITTGVAVLLTGTSVAVGQTMACDGAHCTTAPVTALAVMVGAALAGVGAVWLVGQDHAISQLDLQQHQLQDELDRLHMRAARQAGSVLAAQPSATLRLRF